MSDNKKKPVPPPSFMGNMMPTNISLEHDDGAEEVTRRVGGTAMMPSFESPGFRFEPSFGFDGGRSMAGAAPQPFISNVPTKMAPPSVMTAPPKVEKFQWILRDVPTLPEFHPLERTAVFVPNTPASVVAVRISDVLWDRSIEATFDNAKAKAKCITSDGVDFRVRLYRGRNQYSHGIIVEVQRRFGFSLSYHSESQAVLDAAEGKPPVPPPPSSSLPLVSDSEDDYDVPDPRSSIQMVSKMFAFRGYDSHHLALQTLTSLTDPAKMGRVTARGVSKELLLPSNQVGRKVVSLVIDTKEEETFGLRASAMTVLANALQAVSGNVSGMLREAIRPVLLNDLRKAQSNPRIAFIAARCIEPLIAGDHDRSELHGILESALEVGTSRHAGLMKQTQRCIKKIES